MLVIAPLVTFLTTSEINAAPSLFRNAFWFAMIIGIFFGLVYAVLLLVFMNGKKMREAYG